MVLTYFDADLVDGRCRRFLGIDVKHQNSYPQESVRGPQIFYFAHSKEAKKAAEVMQTELKNFDQEHAREIKGNTTYYMLKNTKSPIVIVECGFLSSPVEAGMLIDEAYQQE